MNKKILVIAIGSIIATTSNLTNAAEINLKVSAPNEYDCTVDELELYVTKRTENLRRGTSISAWEDFKKAQSGSDVAESTGDVSADAATAAAGAAGADDDEEDEECSLFYDDLKEMDTSVFDITLPEIGAGIANAGTALAALAKEQTKLMAESMAAVLEKTICERATTEYLTEVATGIANTQLNETYGYDIDDFTDEDFKSTIVNDQLKQETGTSNGKMLNILDTDLNDNRESYMEKTMNGYLDNAEDIGVDGINNGLSNN